MNFTYPVLTEAQIEAQRPTLEDGNHPAKVIKAESKISKNGNNMAFLTLEIWNLEGKLFKANDFLVAIESMAYKTRNFWISAEKPEMYETGTYPIEEFENQYVTVKTRLEKELNGDRKFIRIVDYVPPMEKEQSTVEIQSSDEIDLNDDIPF